MAWSNATELTRFQSALVIALHIVFTVFSIGLASFFAVLIYMLLDGFDLGLGINFFPNNVPLSWETQIIR